MTVKELIEELSNFDQEMEVHIAYNYGDHGRTTVAPKVNTIDEMWIEHSDYHRMPVVTEEEVEEKDDDQKVVVVIQA